MIYISCLDTLIQKYCCIYSTMEKKNILKVNSVVRIDPNFQENIKKERKMIIWSEPNFDLVFYIIP